MTERVFCKCCTRKLNIKPFIGEKVLELQDGTYCEKCAEVEIKRRRRT